MNWPQLAYAYGLGGAFFFLTLFLCFRPGGNERANASDRVTLVTLLVGLAGFLAANVAWILLAT